MIDIHIFEPLQHIVEEGRGVGRAIKRVEFRLSFMTKGIYERGSSGCSGSSRSSTSHGCGEEATAEVVLEESSHIKEWQVV